MLRALFPLVGSGFVLGGWYVTSLTVGCATPFPHGARVALSGGLAVLLVVAVLAGIRGVLREPR
ncbi:MAG TPA: hypothetical protein VK665_06465 [Candidatus Elarobacter sp.]|nr:hypothetical protein [Candidatus Elarobacter sp.]